MELDPVDRTIAVSHRHDEPVFGLRAHLELIRRGLALDDERVIARRLERAVQAAKDALSVVGDAGNLAVHRLTGAHDLAAEGLSDRLMAEADAENRGGFARSPHEVEADACLIRRAWARREHDRLGSLRQRLLHADLVVAPDRHLRAELAEIVHEVEREAVIIVDEGDALHSLSGRVERVFSDGRPRSSSKSGPPS